MDDGRVRCGWCLNHGPAYLAYHDTEWGVPMRDDARQFEFLVLESAQAGLSWSTVLNKREGYRRAFAGFDPERVARFNARSVARLMQDAGIVRNRAKIEAAIGNARAFLALKEQAGSFGAWLWSFTDGQPVLNRWRRMEQVPAQSPLSDTVSAEMRKRGFRFLGSTTLYAHLQATGIVNDHLVSCFRHAECRALARSFPRRGAPARDSAKLRCSRGRSLPAWCPT
jgi:DNA-3-methyladenine glycosylase I